MKTPITYLLLILLCIFTGCSEQPEIPEARRYVPTTPRGSLEWPESIGATEFVEVTNLSARESDSDWPRFLGPTSDSKSPEVGLQANPLDIIKVAFTLELGEGYATVAISDGKMFVFDRHDGKARLRCCNSMTGKELWKFTYESDYRDLYGYDSGPRAQPIVDGERVYIYGVEGILHCLRTTDGKLFWKRNVSKVYHVVQNFFGVGSCPYVYDDLLLVMVGGSDKDSWKIPPGSLDRVTGDGKGIVAFDKITGEEQWRLSDELASYSSPVVNEINGRPYGLAFMRGGLLAFHPKTGKQDFFFPWRSPKLESANASNPVVVGDKVFISETYGPGAALLKVTATGYEVVWHDDPKKRDRAMQTHWNTAIHVDGYLYGSSGRHKGDAELRCIDFNNGEVKWSQPGLTRSSLTYIDGRFICLSEDGKLREIKASPKEFKESRPVLAWRPNDSDDGLADDLLKEPAWAAPVISRGKLYVRGRGKLVCLQLPSRDD